MKQIDPFTSFFDRISFSQLARREGVHVGSIWRWTLHGVRGIRLRSVRVGGRRWVFESDWKEFSAALNSDLVDTPATLTPTAATDRAERAGADLDKLLGGGRSRRRKSANS